MLIRMRELAIQAGSDTVGDKERGFINKEIQSLVEEVDRISHVTNFNGTPLLNGQSKKGHLEFQVGIRADESDRLQFNVKENDVRAESLGINKLDYSSIDGARSALEVIDKAMERVFESRARLGAMQNKLQATVNNIGISKDNLEEARSRIADTDIASETSALVRSNILQAASTSVLAQANTTPQQALKLL
jgi:flagellin